MTYLAQFLRYATLAAALVVPVSLVSAQTKLTSVAKGLVNPESVAFDAQGRLLVTTIGEFDKDGDGQVLAFVGAQKTVVADGLNDPKGITVWETLTFVTDKTRVMRIDAKGNLEVWAEPSDFPKPPKFLNDIVADARGNLYVSDSGDLKGAEGAVYRISSDRTITTVLDSSNPAVQTPNGLIFDGEDLLVLDFNSGVLSRCNLKDKSLTKIADGFPGGDGLAWDWDHNLYVTEWKTGRVSVLRDGKGPAETISSTDFQAAADLASHPRFGTVFVPDMKAGTVTPLAWVNNNPKVDESPLAAKIVPAFTSAQVDRPIIVTHAGDGSGRIFIVSQKGKIYSLAGNEPNAEPKLFFDLTSKVRYLDNQNEEGFLGFAFHPKFKDNGQFFAYYTTKNATHTSIISRFTASKETGTADLTSEQEVLRVPQPYWNHNGGTLAFGPDGYLYVGLGDGGAGNDPHGHAQDPSTLLGKILRLDVDRAGGGLKYGIPKDNPLVGQAGARGEIFACGFRNIWRMSFDRQGGQFWVADVGQDIWEEINIVTKGGNYGWNAREARHKFRANGSGPKAEYVEPIWEYHHDIGKSVTGGFVYRGKQVPELNGLYVYADYVTGRIWGLKYDEAKKQVVANRPINGNTQSVMSFGEDEQGEIYFTTPSGQMFKFAAGN
jgi:glucose/arabinose dehydrogenase